MGTRGSRMAHAWHTPGPRLAHAIYSLALTLTGHWTSGCLWSMLAVTAQSKSGRAALRERVCSHWQLSFCPCIEAWGGISNGASRPCQRTLKGAIHSSLFTSQKVSLQKIAKKCFSSEINIQFVRVVLHTHEIQNILQINEFWYGGYETAEEKIHFCTLNVSGGRGWHQFPRAFGPGLSCDGGELSTFKNKEAQACICQQMPYFYQQQSDIVAFFKARTSLVALWNATFCVVAYSAHRKEPYDIPKLGKNGGGAKSRMISDVTFCAACHCSSLKACCTEWTRDDFYIPKQEQEIRQRQSDTNQDTDEDEMNITYLM